MSTAELSPETKNWLVTQAEMIGEKVKGQKGQTSQLRNLLQIAQTESEILVLRNFIRYQAGRRATRGFWENIHEDVIRILREIGEKSTTHGLDWRRSAIQHFFGYLVRHYVYVTEVAKAGAEG